MNEIEQRIRELRLPNPRAVFDERMAELFSSARVVRRPGRSRWGPLVGVALAAGVAGFALGLGTGQWLDPPRHAPPGLVSAPHEGVQALVAPATFVQLTDSRISDGLDFSQSLEPFHVQLTSQEGL